MPPLVGCVSKYSLETIVSFPTCGIGNRENLAIDRHYLTKCRDVTIYHAGVVMIRCDITKAKTRQNFVDRDAKPRNSEGFVVDLGNVGEY